MSRIVFIVVLTFAAVVNAQPTAPAIPIKPMFLDQAWKAADREWFYTISQGSQMIPYTWFLALERPDSETSFRADNLSRFGYLPNPDKVNNPDGLPVGFVKDVDDQTGPWLGLNCSACHTRQIEVAGKTLQIDGGPTDADMFALISELATALSQTAGSKTDPKFQRFAAKMLDPGHSGEEEDALYDNLKSFSDGFTEFVGHSTSKVVWGPARLDAFGMIFNRATAIDLKEASNNHEPNAPVSYPFLWDTSWHDKVQWNGSAPNELAIERLARNVGEVLGVFAHTDIKKTFLPPLYFRTTAKRLNQLVIENKLSELRSPSWPHELAAIDQQKAAAGKKLYDEHCISCHQVVERSKPNRRIKVAMVPLAKAGTDPQMATNAATLTSKSGVLKGVRMPFFFGVPPIKETELSLELTSRIVIGAILAPPDWQKLPTLPADRAEVAKALSEKDPAEATERVGFVRSVLRKRLYDSMKAYAEKESANAKALAYRARPLDGIWATAPYLHNGSVPNLYQLFLPAADRVKEFYVGSRELDAENVGFRSDKTDGAFLFDTSKPGNLNSGHDTYGTDDMSEEQRRQLVEYLKTL